MQIRRIIRYKCCLLCWGKKFQDWQYWIQLPSLNFFDQPHVLGKLLTSNTKYLCYVMVFYNKEWIILFILFCHLQIHVYNDAIAINFGIRKTGNVQNAHQQGTCYMNYWTLWADRCVGVIIHLQGEWGSCVLLTWKGHLINTSHLEVYTGNTISVHGCWGGVGKGKRSREFAFHCSHCAADQV